MNANLRVFVVCIGFLMVGAPLFAAEEGSEQAGTAAKAQNNMNDITIEQSVLVVFSLAACLTCIYMVFFFGRRLQTSAYLRDSLLESAKHQEYLLLLRELKDRAMAGPLDPEDPPPPGYGSTDRLWASEKYATADVDSWIPKDESEQERKDRLAREDERRKRNEEIRTWEKAEKVRYEKLRKQAETEALERAEKKVPESIDISLLGGGWAFLLEFSTVIVIIFALLIFGIIGTLEGGDIATILAAIAGYVLGKATAGTKSTERSGSVTPPATE